MFRPLADVTEDGSHVNLVCGTKGGRRREIPIDSDIKRSAIDAARRLVPNADAPLACPDRTLEQNRNRFYTVIRKFGIRCDPRERIAEQIAPLWVPAQCQCRCRLRSAWEPPHRFAMTWHPGIEAACATRLEVEFRPDGKGCSIRLVHDGWTARGDEAPALRQRYEGGWVVVLDSFAATAARWALA